MVGGSVSLCILGCHDRGRWLCELMYFGMS